MNLLYICVYPVEYTVLQESQTKNQQKEIAMHDIRLDLFACSAKNSVAEKR